MKLLKTINPANIPDNVASAWQHREAARAVVFDENGKVGLLYVSKFNHYKLPGGGIETGEDKRQALDREVEEELGVEVEVLDEVGAVIEYRDRFKQHQISFCFTAKVVSSKNSPNFTAVERDAGFEVKWVTPQQAEQLLNLRETDDYLGRIIEERDFCFLKAALKNQV